MISSSFKERRRKKKLAEETSAKQPQKGEEIQCKANKRIKADLAKISKYTFGKYKEHNFSEKYRNGSNTNAHIEDHKQLA